MCRLPATTAPTWWAWQLSVPTTGLMHSDQRQPGCAVIRAALMPSRSRISRRVLSGVRTSSADPKSFFTMPAISFSLPARHGPEVGIILFLQDLIERIHGQDEPRARYTFVSCLAKPTL